jgi:transcriptional regulator with XRE-family HTH domain
MDRPEVSRRLKAARWLRGGLDEKGRPAPLSPEELAQREPLKRNGITANAISEIERMVKDARPMELREITVALDLPADWFTDDAAAEPLTPEALRGLFGQLLERIDQAGGRAPLQARTERAGNGHADRGAGGVAG